MRDLLKFGITANNRSAAGFAAVRKELGGVKGALMGVQDVAKRTGKSMRNIGAGLSAGVTAPIALAGKQMLSLYDKQVKAEAAVAQAIRSTGGAAGKTLGDLKAMATGLQGVTTFGDEDILGNVTAPLLTFTKVQGDVFERAQANVIDYASLLKMDLKSASLQVGKALNDPVKGINALSRAGVQFTDAQKDVIKSLVQGGDVAGAQMVILKELETQFKGQAAAAAATPLGQWAQLSNAIGDVKEQLGQEITPFLKPLLQNVRAGVRWFGALSPEIKRNVVVVGGLAAAVGPLVAGLGLVVMGVGAVSSALAGAASLLLANPIGLALTAIAGGAYLIYRNWDGISEWFKEKWATVSAVFTTAWDGIKSLVLNYTPPGLIYKHWEGIADWFGNAMASVQTSFALGWAGIKGMLAASYGPAALLYDLWQDIGAWFSGLSGSVVQAFQEIWSAVKAEVATWPEMMIEAGKSVVNGLIDGVLSAPGKVAAAAKTLANDLLGSFKGMLGIQSPSRVFMQMGKHVVDGLGVGISNHGGVAVKAIQGVTGLVTEAARKTDGVMKGLRSGAMNAFQSVLTGAQSFKGALGQMLGGFGSQLLNKGVSGLFDAIWPNAKGNVFSQGKMTAFAKGGIVNGPTLFGMAGKNTGLMGEAGPEAILPLSRGADGRLGVRAESGGAGGSAQVTVNFAPVIDARGTDAAVEARLEAQLQAFAEQMPQLIQRTMKQGQNRRLNRAWLPS